MARILCLNPGQDVGGAEVYLANLARHLANRHTLHLLAHPSTGIVEYFQRELPDISLETSSMAYSGLPRLLAKTRHLIRHHRIELVHINGRRQIVLAPFLKLYEPQIKLVATFHSSYFNQDESLLKALSLWLLHLAPLHFCDRIIAVSQKVYQERRSQFIPKKKLRLIKNGIDVERFSFLEPARMQMRQEIRQRYGLNEALVIGEVGRLVRGKGQHILLEAAARLRRSGYDLKVLLVGEGPSRNELEHLCRKLQIEAQVIFAGLQPDTRPFLAAMDIFVLPSLNEGMPLSLLEAMAMKLPVIATRSGGISELLDDGRTGLLAPVDDVNALTLRLTELLKNAALQQQLAREAQAHVRAQFDQRKMLMQHDDVFNELMFAV